MTRQFVFRISIFLFRHDCGEESLRTGSLHIVSTSAQLLTDRQESAFSKEKNNFNRTVPLSRSKLRTFYYHFYKFHVYLTHRLFKTINFSESSSFLKSDQRSGECGWSPDCKACNLSTTPDVKPKRPVERFLSASTSMGRRLKAKAFRGDKQQCSKDDMLFGSPGMIHLIEIQTLGYFERFAAYLHVEFQFYFWSI
jgi:hypothetical protein